MDSVPGIVAMFIEILKVVIIFTAKIIKRCIACI